jgi:hypothetical protein
MGLLQGLNLMLGNTIPTLHWETIIIYEVDDRHKESLVNKREIIDDFLRSRGYEIKSLAASYLDGSWNVHHGIVIPS